MNLNDCIDFYSYCDSAKAQMSDLQIRLSEIEDNFNKRMNGKTMEKVIGSFVGLLVWLVVLITGTVAMRGKVNGFLLFIAFIASFGLIVLLIYDTFTDFFYLERFSFYQKSISELQNRVNNGKNSIGSDYDALMKARSEGWNHKLNAQPSILDEALKVSTAMSNIKSLQKGFYNKAINYFYYGAVVAVTIVGSIALYPVSDKGINAISGISSSEPHNVINGIALVVTVIVMLFVALVAWNMTGCNVTAMTLFAIPLGPAMFVAITALGTAIFYIGIIVIGVGVGVLLFIGSLGSNG